MAMNDDPSDTGPGRDPFGRALEAARTAPAAPAAPAGSPARDGGWAVLADEVMQKARRTVRPDRTVLAADASAGRTLLSTRVLLADLRDALAAAGTHAPDDISFTVEGEELQGVRVDLVARYGTDLVRLATEVRGLVHDRVAALVPRSAAREGAADGPGPVTVDVSIVDVVQGDPRLA